MANLITVAQTLYVQRPASKSGSLTFRISRSLSHRNWHGRSV